MPDTVGAPEELNEVLIVSDDNQLEVPLARPILDDPMEKQLHKD